MTFDRDCLFLIENLTMSTRQHVFQGEQPLHAARGILNCK